MRHGPLTTNVDDFDGTSANDTFIAQDVLVNGGAVQTFKPLDSLDGGLGDDTFNLFDQNNAIDVAGSNVSNIETVNVQGAKAVDVDSSSWTGVETLNVQAAGGAVTLDAANTTNVTASGLSDALTDINGGKSATVTQTMDKAADQIAIDGVGDVTVTATESDAAAAGIFVGANEAVTGEVNVTSTGAAADGDDATLDTIAVTGGTTVNVTQSATSDATAAATDADGATITQGAVTVTAGDSTTSVTVAQDQEVAEKNARAATAGVAEKQSVKFVALADGESVTIDGLTFTASKALSAAQVAEAFAGLSKGGDTQDAGGPIPNGVYTGSLDANWVSGEANGDTVVFSQAVANTGTFNGNSDTAAAGNIVVTKTADAVAGTTAVTGVLGVANGAVTIDDNATKSVTDVVVDGYGNGATLGDNSSLDALQNLTLKNSASGTAAVTTAATVLALNVEDVDAAVSIDEGAATVETLNLTADAEASDFDLKAAAVTNLNVTANVGLTLAGSAFGSLEAVTVAGAGKVDLGDISGEVALDSFNASANTGGVVATVEGDAGTITGSLTEYVLSGGNDNVTVNATTGTAADVKVTAGAGDDTVTLGSGITTAGGVISGGEGTDTLGMTAADAAGASAAATFETKIDGFERLALAQVAAGASNTINLANMDDIAYVKSAGGAATASEAEEFTATFADNGDTDTSTITFDGVSVNMTGGEADAAAVAARFVAGYNADAAATYTATDNLDGTVTFVSKTDGQRTDVTAADFVVTNAAANEPAEVDVTGVTIDNQGVDADAAAALVLNNMADNGTLELTATSDATVNMTDATGGADTFNIVLNNDATTNFGSVEVDKVETINIAANDVFTDANKDGKDDNNATHTLEVSADAAKSIVVTGDDLVLDTDSTVLTSVDASALTGGLQYTADGAVAGTTVTGGAGADNLTADGSSDVLNGGAGNDTLKGADLTSLTGGAGADTFVMNKPTNVNSYSTIEDLSSGDIIDFANGTVVFKSAGVELAATAVFQDYANAAVNSLGADDDDAAWFQFGGDTYIVQSGDTTANNDFQNGTDSIIKIVGAVDLSAASYNQTNGTLEIA